MLNDYDKSSNFLMLLKRKNVDVFGETEDLSIARCNDLIIQRSIVGSLSVPVVVLG